MTRTTDRDDALVDTYRALRALNHPPAPLPVMVDGAGPRVTTVRPGKRLRAWHRASAWNMPLRAFVRLIAADEAAPAHDRSIATRWLCGKASA